MIRAVTTTTALALCFFLAACLEQKQPEPRPASPTAELDRGVLPMLAFTCAPDSPYLAVYHAGGDSVTLLGPGGHHTLRQSPAASGARYQSKTHTLWTKGEQVTLVIDGTPAEYCQATGRNKMLARHWNAGAVFLAMGQEPAWTLVATANQVSLTLGYEGQPRIFPHGLIELPAGLQPSGVFELSDESGEISVELIAEFCGDAMSGEPYGVGVRINTGQQVLTGCGLSFR